MGKRELKKDATRMEVFRAALELFRSKGFDATSIEEIASAAGISQRTLFRYFASKADIVFVPAWENFQLLCKSIRSRPPSETIFEAAETATLEHAQHLQSRPDAILEMSKMRRAHPVVDQRRSYLLHVEFPEAIASELAARDGVDSPEPIHMVAARFIMCLLSMGVDMWVEDQTRSLHEHIQDLIGSINQEFRGIS